MLKCHIIVLAALLVLPASYANAQKDSQADEAVGVFQNRQEYNQFMGRVKQSAYGEGGSPELQAMLPMLNDIVLSREVGSTANQYNASASTLGLLASPDIRRDIEMVDDQYQELRDLSSSIQRRSAEKLRDLDFDNRDNLLEEIRKIREQSESEIQNVLLPHQIDRLRQIGMQAQLQRRSLVQILTSNPLKSDLKITDEQSEALKIEEKQIEKDLEKEIAKLRERARDQLLSKLKPTQKAEVKGMIGDAFEFKNKRTKNSKAAGKRVDKQKKNKQAKQNN